MKGNERKQARSDRRAERLRAAKAANPERLDIMDVSHLTGYSVSYLYTLVHFRKIPYYKPNGGYIHFLKGEILDWYNERKKTRFNF